MFIMKNKVKFIHFYILSTLIKDAVDKEEF